MKRIHVKNNELKLQNYYYYYYYYYYYAEKLSIFLYLLLFILNMIYRFLKAWFVVGLCLNIWR